MNQIRRIIAHNPSAMTLDGTRTYIVGTVRVAVIDPGPLLHEHLDAVAETIGSGASVSVLTTHAHPDHADGAGALARRVGASWPALTDGDVFETDAGLLEAIATPGHTPDHVAFNLRDQQAVFCGDLMMGGLDTALVALPEGDLQQYLQSLEKLRALEPRVIYPAHGEPFHDPPGAIDRYLQHRQQRVAQVVAALESGPKSAAALVQTIYGAELDPTLRSYAESAVEAYLAYLLAEDHVQRASYDSWSLR